MPRVSSIQSKDPKPTIGIYSFGEKGNVFPKAQFEFDISKFRDPTGQKQFAGMDGVNPLVRDWVGEDDRVPAVIQQVRLIADDLIKPKVRDGGSGPSAVSAWLSFSFRDYHGKWAAPAVAELVAEALSRDGFVVATVHYNLKGSDGNPKFI